MFYMKLELLTSNLSFKTQASYSDAQHTLKRAK